MDRNVMQMKLKQSKELDLLHTVYSDLENLVLWARSEKDGFAVTLHSGIMEYWVWRNEI